MEVAVTKAHLTGKQEAAASTEPSTHRSTGLGHPALEVGCDGRIFFLTLNSEICLSAFH